MIINLIVQSAMTRIGMLDQLSNMYQKKDYPCGILLEELLPGRLSNKLGRVVLAGRHGINLLGN
jgi:hypothetical protein